jgi:hypothetical protein
MYLDLSVVLHTYNPSYLGGWHRRITSLRPARQYSETLSQKTQTDQLNRRDVFGQCLSLFSVAKREHLRLGHL